MNKFYTPLRYPGGKRKISGFIEAVLEKNLLLGKSYIEPYAGGAGLALKLLFTNKVDEIFINDIDTAIYSFWISVLTATEDLCEMILGTEVTIDEWFKQREILLNPDKYTTLEMAFSIFFLNRTNRSGIITGGVIGGKKQEGDWKLDVRFNKTDLIKRIRKIATKRSQIHASSLDAMDFLVTIPEQVNNEFLLYLDPPYYVKGKKLYQNHYQHDDHVALSNTIINDLDNNWIISYDNVDEIKQLYADTNGLEYNLNYTAQDKYEASEVMFFSDRLQIPIFQGYRSLPN